MSKVLITRSKLDDLATSISAKSGEALPLTLDEMKDAVDGIQTGGGATQHEIHLEFTDSTDTDIEVDYNDSWVGNLITSTKPKTYGLKEVLYAQLDGVTWYEATIIPLNTELVDFTKVSSNTAIGEQGEAFEQEWSYATDYTAAAPDMIFSYTAYTWFYIGLYDESKTMIRTIYAYNDGTPDPNDGNTTHGTLNNLPSNTAYVRLCGTAPNSSKISLIRTA